MGKIEDLHRFPSIQAAKWWTLTQQLEQGQKPVDTLDKTHRLRSAEQPAPDRRHFPMSESFILIHHNSTM